jgi:hypothetical protein
VSGFFEPQHDFDGFFVFDDFRVSGAKFVSLASMVHVCIHRMA